MKQFWKQKKVNTKKLGVNRFYIYELNTKVSKIAFEFSSNMQLTKFKKARIFGICLVINVKIVPNFRIHLPCHILYIHTNMFLSICINLGNQATRKIQNTPKTALGS